MLLRFKIFCGPCRALKVRPRGNQCAVSGPPAPKAAERKGSSPQAARPSFANGPSYFDPFIFLFVFMPPLVSALLALTLPLIAAVPMRSVFCVPFSAFRAPAPCPVLRAPYPVPLAPSSVFHLPPSAFRAQCSGACAL